MAYDDLKPGFISQIKHQNEIWIISFQQISGKRIKKSDMKKFLKNLSFGVDDKL